MSIFSRTKSDDEELSDVLKTLNNSALDEESASLPSHPGEFLGIENPAKPSPKKSFFSLLDKFLPGFKDVTKNDNEIKKDLAKEASSLSARSSIPVITEPSGNSELEALLRPLAKQEMASILNNEYDQEAMFVKYERQRSLSQSVNLLIAGVSAAIFMLMAIKYAGPFIHNLTDPNLAPTGFLAKTFGSTIAQGINFVAAMTSIVLAFLTLVLTLMSFTSSFKYGRARSLVVGTIAIVGLMLWLALIMSQFYIYSFALALVLLLAVRSVGR